MLMVTFLLPCFTLTNTKNCVYVCALTKILTWAKTKKKSLSNVCASTFHITEFIFHSTDRLVNAHVSLRTRSPYSHPKVNRRSSSKHKDRPLFFSIELCNKLLRTDGFILRPTSPTTLPSFDLFVERVTQHRHISWQVFIFWTNSSCPHHSSRAWVAQNSSYDFCTYRFAEIGVSTLILRKSWRYAHTHTQRPSIRPLFSQPDRSLSLISTSAVEAVTSGDYLKTHTATNLTAAAAASAVVVVPKKSSFFFPLLISRRHHLPQSSPPSQSCFQKCTLAKVFGQWSHAIELVHMTFWINEKDFFHFWHFLNLIKCFSQVFDSNYSLRIILCLLWPLSQPVTSFEKPLPIAWSSFWFAQLTNFVSFHFFFVRRHRLGTFFFFDW